MATSAFTVERAIRRVKQKIRRHAASISLLDYIEAIDDANQTLWRTITLTYRGWFTATADLALAVGDLEYNLPANFHQVYFLEVTTADKEDYRFLPSAMTNDKWREERQSTEDAAETDRDFYFDIVGDNPAVFVLARSIPAAETGGLTLKVWYVKELDILAAISDTLDPAVAPFFGPLCTRAAAQLVKTRDSELAAALEAEWATQRAEVVMLAQRAVNEPLVTKHLDPQTGAPGVPAQQGQL